MSLAELVPMVQTLPRADKQRLVELLAGELANDDGCDPELDLISNSTQIVWSPYDDSHEAAAVLLDMLREEGTAK